MVIGAPFWVSFADVAIALLWAPPNEDRADAYQMSE